MSQFLGMPPTSRFFAGRSSMPAVTSTFHSNRPARVAQEPDLAGFSSIRFGHALEKNHGVQVPMNVEIDLDQSAQVQRALLIRALEKQSNQDDSNITLWLDSLTRFNWPAASDGFADAIGMTDIPVDVVIKSHLNTSALKPLLAATGKRFMMDRAKIMLDPPKGFYNGPVHEANARVRLYEEKTRDLEWLVMNKAGVRRDEIQADFKTGRSLNALSALAYGKQGLVEGVIVGDDAILSRKTLDQYYRAHGLFGKKNQEARQAFNEGYDSIDKVVEWARENNKLQPLKQFSAKSLTQKPTPLYEEGEGNLELSPAMLKQVVGLLEEKIPGLKGLGQQIEGSLKELTSNGKKKLAAQTYLPDGKKQDFRFSRTMTLKSQEKIPRIQLENLPKSQGPNTYRRDTVYFPVGFNVETGNQLEAALQLLVEKKQQQQASGEPVSNISIVENSPGGMSIVTEQIKSAIAHAGVPVDVTIQGMGASGGSKLISMATGNRFMTPNSIILLHQTRGGRGVSNLEEVSESVQNMAYSSEGYMSMIAQRSGRPLEEVRKDFKLDFWINAVEAIVYGPKGLTDGILLGPDEVITREDVMALIAEKKGGLNAAEAYIQAKFEERRNGETSAPSKAHQELNEDPLANPLAVIEELKTTGKVQKLSQVERFKPSSGKPQKSLDLLTVLDAKS